MVRLISSSGGMGEGTGNPLQYSCLGNPLNRGAWWATVHGVTECQKMKQARWTSGQSLLRKGKSKGEVHIKFRCSQCVHSKFYRYPPAFGTPCFWKVCLTPLLFTKDLQKVFCFCQWNPKRIFAFTKQKRRKPKIASVVVLQPAITEAIAAP